MTTVNHTMTTELIRPLPNDQKVLKSAKTTHRTSIDTMSAGNKTRVKSQKNNDSKVSDLGETKGTQATTKAKASSKDTPTLPLKAVTTALTKQDQEHIALLETRVDAAPLTSFRAILELETYKDGIAWNPVHENFAAYAKNRFGFSPSHAGRSLAAGGFVKKVEDAGKSEVPVSEIQIRHVLNKIPDTHQVACWEKLAPKGSDPKKMTGSWVKEEVSKYWKSLPPEIQAFKPARAAKKGTVATTPTVLPRPQDLVAQLQESTARLSKAREINDLLEQVENLISESAAVHVDSKDDKGNLGTGGTAVTA